MSPTITPLRSTSIDAEEGRLDESRRREKHWKRWGPYLSERAWGTVREDYSPGGTAWDDLPHDHARSRAAGTRTASPASPTGARRSASPWPSGTGWTPS